MPYRRPEVNVEPPDVRAVRNGELGRVDQRGTRGLRNYPRCYAFYNVVQPIKYLIANAAMPSVGSCD
jgi:hypothetical protein